MIFRRKTKIDYKAMVNIVPTSKYDLKMQCMAIAKGNLEEAGKLYNFLAKDLNIPDVIHPKPTVMQQIKETAGSLFGFVKDNQNDFVQAYNYIQAIRTGSPIQAANIADAAQSAAELPPLVTPNMQ